MAERLPVGTAGSDRQRAFVGAGSGIGRDGDPHPKRTRSASVYVEIRTGVEYVRHEEGIPLRFIEAVTATGLVVHKAVRKDVTHKTQFDCRSGDGVFPGAEVGSVELHAVESRRRAEHRLGVDLFATPSHRRPTESKPFGDGKLLVVDVRRTPAETVIFEFLLPFSRRHQGVAGGEFIVGKQILCFRLTGKG